VSENAPISGVESRRDEKSFIERRSRLVTSLLFNVVGFGTLWVAYSSIRKVTANSVRTARENAISLLHAEEWMGLPSEAMLQKLLLPYEWIVRSANIYYVGFHFPSIIVFLVWVMFWKREWMPRIRLALIGSTAVGLLIHLAYPLAPPRMFPGFVDTAELIGPDPYALGLAAAANQFAAMPSMHVAWALLISVGVIAALKTRWRWLIALHPIVTTIVVVVTGNHYWSDVFVGGLLGSMGWWASGRFRPLNLESREAVAEICEQAMIADAADAVVERER